ncbi:MAG: ABC-F family ATP-binding cassette domain-containing protein, partial [Firmicutes bacterium]|nr:ABC-F family ATP-binding cassette domain-containing protein [Bacillota bacterium]
DRLALSGKNGSGKTTLIKSILQKCDPDRVTIDIVEKGSCEVAKELVVSYIGQETAGLKGNIVDYCEKYHLDRSLFCTILRQLDFERDQFWKNIEHYSEGQKKKVLLAKSLATPAHLYIWDEPLNYIDIFSRIQIENLILEYEPTLLFVEHDRKFCDKIATKIIEL